MTFLHQNQRKSSCALPLVFATQEVRPQVQHNKYTVKPKKKMQSRHLLQQDMKKKDREAALTQEQQVIHLVRLVLLKARLLGVRLGLGETPDGNLDCNRYCKIKYLHENRLFSRSRR